MSSAIFLAERPDGELRATDLRIGIERLPSIADGEIRVAIQYLSIDPFTRIFLDEHPLGGSLQGLPIGSVLPGAAVARVTESRTSDFRPGDLVEGRFGWREEAVSPSEGIRRIDAELGDPQSALGILGLPGMTAYAGIVGVGGIQPGETAIISSAAGAVGLTAGQIAKIKGARAVGIAGGPSKCAMVLDHGFDACIDYKASGFEDALREVCPGGAQVYLDNVGGRVAMAAYSALAGGGRVALCGLLSLYQGEGGDAGDLGRFMRLIMSRGLKVQAYGTIHMCPPEALSELSRWMKAGLLRIPQATVEGLAAAPQAFADLLKGVVSGKLIVRI